jgi:ubiquinone/menaquinone biosynthesis C-methylase UbiE
VDEAVRGNIDRFSGFADEYDRYRPGMPGEAIDIILMYLGREAGCVVDLGSGTGLSTMPWADFAREIIGIEPNPDMRARAEEKARSCGNVRFVAGLSNRTGLGDCIADVVTCSQSFHWMEPQSTLKEVARILKPGGVFAAYDCDWPPYAGAEAERAYENLFEAVETLERSRKLSNNITKWNKSEHLRNIRESGLFGHTREVVFSHVEECDSRRFTGLALSQGGLQTLLKNHVAEIVPYIESFTAASARFFGKGTKKIRIGYRMRLGVK